MANQFGLTPQGFKPMALSDARADLQAAMRTAFGSNVNLDPRSLLGNLVDVFAERFALLWQLSQAVYGANNVNEASGQQVDNILALNNLQRIPATPTKTAPTPVTQSNGVTLYGLVLYGDPGTVIPKGALITDGLAAPTTFALDADVTIAAPANAQQTVSFSNTPTSGSFSLGLTDGLGNAFTTPSFAYGASAASIQTAVTALARPDGTLPFTDLLVSANGNGYQLDFGAGTLIAGSPSCAATAIPLVTVASNSLQQSSAVTNITVLEPRVGAPAQGVGSATATVTGPVSELAGALTTIATPQAGWSSVTNQLDAITGSNVETDAAALARMASLRAAQGSASLAAIIERVKQVSGVSACIGFENKTSAALQQLTFTKPPTAGGFALALAGGQTATISAPITAGSVQAAINAVANYQTASVTGDPVNGITIDFAGSQGGQPQQLCSVLNNTSNAVLSVAYARPAHSVEIVAEGGATSDVANAILAALPAGVSAWGSPVLRTLGNINQGSANLTVASAIGAAAGQIATMQSLPLGTQIASVSGQSITLTQVGQSTVSNASLVLQNGSLLTDSQSNVHLVTFTRPVQTLIYVSCVILSDAKVQPGVASSANNANSQWSVASVPTIQQAIADVINSVPIGGTILARGTNGVSSSFRDVKGVVDATVYFDTVNPPANTGNLSLQAAQSAVCELANVAVSFT